MAGQRVTLQNIAGAIALDVVLTLLFVLVGRGSHTESFEIAGVMETWWPFLIGAIIGWMITRAWRKPHDILWQGVGVWLSTVVVGMLLRVVTAQGTEFSFVIVATIALGILLIGWRLIARFFTRRRVDA